MDKKLNGKFSLGLESAMLQLKNLFADCGGDSARALLDDLSQLSSTEREKALQLFSGVVQRLLSSEERLAEQQDAELKDFEESLYRELLSSMREAANDEPRLVPLKRSPLAVVEGGKFKSLLKTQTAHTVEPVTERGVKLSARRRKQAPNLTLIN